MRLGEGFHTHINGGLFSSPNNVGHHNPPLFGPSVLAGTLSFLQSIWDRPQIHPLWGPASLLAHYLVSTPLRRTTRRLAHRPMSGSDTICNGPNLPLADIVLFELFPFWAGFKTRLLGEGFYTLINGGLFSSPPTWTSHFSYADIYFSFTQLP